MKYLNTIWKKLLVIYLIVVIPMIIILVVDGIDDINNRRGLSLERRSDFSRLSAHIFENFVSEVFEDQQALGLIITEGPHTEREISNFIRPIKKTHFLSGLWFLNGEKKVVGGLPNRDGADFSDREAIIKTVKRPNVITNVDKQLRITFASRVVREGKTAGFLFSEFKAADFSNLFPKLKHGGGIVVVDKSGTLVFQNIQLKNPQNRDWSNLAVVKRALEGKRERTSFFKPSGFKNLIGAIGSSDNLGWAVGSFVNSDEALAPIRFDVIVSALAALAAVIIALLVSVFLAASIARPVRKLSREAQELGKGKLDRKIAIQTGDEVQTLSQHLDSMRLQLKQTLEQTKFLQKKQQEIADALQKSFLPPQIPRIKRLAIGVHYESATEAAAVGGDFYDFVSLDSSSWVIVAGDVSGKGIEAAADTAMIKYILRGYLLQSLSLADSMKELNNMVQKQTAPGHFVSLVATLHKGNGLFELVNAGHPQPLLYSKKQSKFIKESGLAVGVFRNQKYESVEVNLDPDDLLVLYTDGLTEAKVGSELFGEERLSLIVADNANDSAEDIAKTCAITAKEFAKGILNDDLLALVVKRTS